MTLSFKQIGISAVILALVAFAFGRFSAPEKVKIETKIQTIEIEKKDTTDVTKRTQDKNQHVETEVTELVRPDGTKETHTKTVQTTEDRSVRENQRTDSETREQTSTKEVSKEITSKDGRLSIAVLGGVKLNEFQSGPKLGAYVGRNLIGPITVGVWGFNDLSCGFALGLSF